MRMTRSMAWQLMKRNDEVETKRSIVDELCINTYQGGVLIWKKKINDREK